MSSNIDMKWSWIEGSHGMRTQLLDLLSDADLAFSPGGQNMSLGALIREMGEVEYSYIQSLKTLKQDFLYRNTEAGLESSMGRLNMWLQALDSQMKEIVSNFSDEDFKKTIDRSGWMTPIDTQLDVYLQALLIFFGKAVIYFKAMNKALPQSILDAI